MVGIVCCSTAGYNYDELRKLLFIEYHNLRHRLVDGIGLEREQVLSQTSSQAKYPSLRVYADAVQGNGFLFMQNSKNCDSSRQSWDMTRTNTLFISLLHNYIERNSIYSVVPVNLDLEIAQTNILFIIHMHICKTFFLLRGNSLGKTLKHKSIVERANRGDVQNVFPIPWLRCSILLWRWIYNYLQRINSRTDPCQRLSGRHIKHYSTI